MPARDENLTRNEASARAALITDLAYTVRLDLTTGDETFGSETVVRFGCASPGATTFVDLTANEVEQVELNGRVLDLDACVAGTRVTLPELQAHNTLRVVATMNYQREGKGLHHFRDPTDDRVYLHSQFEPFDAHLVYACFDQPDLKGTFAFSVDAPAGWVVVSNSAATDTPDEGAAGRWSFAPTPPLSPYVTAIVAGAYDVVRDRHGDLELGFYVRRSLSEHLDTDELIEVTRQGLDWFAEAFAMAYPFGKYDQLFVPEFSAGAMENPGCITFSEAYVFRSKVTDAARERRAETLLHEMAHMWFGDLVTMRWWDDLWLNESFATFMAVLSQATATRFSNAWVTFLDSEKAWAKLQDQLPSTHPIAADMVDIESVHQNFDGITYAKGASVLRQLVAWVGQEHFLEGCRRYFSKHAWDNAELRDFLSALEDSSGRELEGWSREWLQTTGVNTLAADFEIDEAGRYASFSIVQTAPDDHPTTRRHRVAVGVYDLRDGGLVRTERVETDVTGARTEVAELVGKPAGGVVLVNDDDLTYAKIRLDPVTTATVTEHLGAFHEPLPRALVWSAAWDMVRDGELPARTYVDMVLNNVATESEIGVLQRLLMRALSAADRYGDPANRATLVERLADHAWGQVATATPGSDAQLAWVRHWAACARSERHLELLGDVLAGEREIEGLALDTDLRWHLVTSLSRHGAASEPLIEAEYERDRTDLGERHAATARAAMPRASAKRHAWEQLLEDTTLSHTMSRQLWGGFSQLDQAAALEGFDEAYFDALDRVWRERSLDWAIEFSQGTFPHALASHDLLGRVDRYLERDDLPKPLRRVLLEQRDTLVRTLRAREVDAAAG